METLKTRNEMNPNDCWDLTKVITNEEEYASLFKDVKKANQKILNLKGHILDNADNLYAFLMANEEESRKFGKLLIYTKLHFDTDTTNSSSKAKYLEVESLENTLHESESFIMSELMEKDLTDVYKLLEEKEELKKYQLYFARLYKNKKRILSEKEEKIIAAALSAFGTPDDAFDSLDIADASFDKIKISPRKTVELSHYNYRELLDHKDVEVRKNAFLKYHEYYQKHKNTFASLLKGNYQELEFLRSIRNYPSALEMELDSIDVTLDVYQNLIAAINKYMDVNVNYQKLKKEILQIPEYHLYDTYMPIGKMKKEKYSKEQAISLVTKALNPLGKDYLKHFLSIFEAHTVDFYPNVGKHSGAYQWGCFDSPSYVLLNFDGTFDSVSTLAHEMGHAVHSMYSKENNPYVYYSYEIFLAEIASTVNETLLSFYMLEHAKEKEEKIYYLGEFLDKVKATIYRQTMFSEFETIMSEKMQKKESLTEEMISDTYYALNQKYFKDSVIIDDAIRYEWMRIPHFYTPFYVYQYATGLISAICIVNDLLEGKKDVQEKYITFLKSGCNKNVLEILQIVDVDLTKKETFDKAFHFIDKKYQELEDLVKGSEKDE